MEPLTKDNPNRFTLFPIEYPDIWEAYQKAKAAEWDANEIDFGADKNDWESLSEEEQYFIEHILAFFAGSDGIVLENLVSRFYNDIQIPEARAFYGFQIHIENVHCVTGDTLLLTRMGYFPIKEYKNCEVEIWNGQEWSNVTVKFTGYHKIYRVELSNGMHLDCTDKHQWLVGIHEKRLDTKNLLEGYVLSPYDYPIIEEGIELPYPWINGYFASTECYIDNRPYVIVDVKDKEAFETFNNLNCDSITLESSVMFCVEEYINAGAGIPINGDFRTKIKWFEGYFDGIGTTILPRPNNDKTSIYFDIENIIEIDPPEFQILIRSKLKSVLREIQLLLSTLNVNAYILPMTKLRMTNHLIIEGCGILKLVELGFNPKKHTNYTLFNKERTPVHVKKVFPLNKVEPTYCFTEPLNHTGIFNGIYTGQSETYGLMIETFVQDPERKKYLFNAIQEIPCVAKKANWALKWIESEESTFAERLIAFIVVEGVFFCGSFCAIYWLKTKGKMIKALCKSNELIARDEMMHTSFGILLYSKCVGKCSEERVHEIFKEAIEIEREFICESLPCRLIGMNSDLMFQYIKYVADVLLKEMKYSPLFNVSNPFPFMDNLVCEGKTNFFEQRVSEYKRAHSVSTKGERVFEKSDDF